MGLKYFVGSLLLLGCYGCSQNVETEQKRFELLPSEKTNITFVNTIQESDSINILTYEYLYNGGGVGVLDVNSDGLSDLFFTGSHVANALYLNKGNFQFEDISTEAGITLTGEWCTGVSIVDVNADGYDDIYVCVGGMGNKSIYPNRLFINQGNMTFKEMADEYGLADPNESIQSVFFDYDKDGDLDMYLLEGGGFERSAITARPIFVNGESRNTDRLYKNDYDSVLDHPVFKDVSKQAGILVEGFGLGVSIVDANEDNWPDVYVSNDYLSRDLIYINNKDGTFTDEGLNYFKHTSHFSMGNDVGDINNDGLPDIVTVDMLPENHIRKKQMFGPNDYDRFYLAVNQKYGYQYMRNMLQLNQGNNNFSEVGQLAGIYQTDWSWAPLLADFDNDGYQDLYITNGFGKDITDLDFVKFKNNAVSPFTDRKESQRLFLDSLKQRPSITLPNYMYRNEKNLTFSNQTDHWGFAQPSISNGSAYADLDGDGDLDIIVSNIDREAFVYRNTSLEENPSTANFLKVRLNGFSANSKGIGSTVSIFTHGELQRRFQQVVRGFQSSVESTIHFGLGSTNEIDSLVVKWPDGNESVLKNIQTNQLITIDYGKSTTESRYSNEKRREKQLTPVQALNFKHQESDYNDFKTQPLLLHGFSNQGPGIAVGDVNGDELDDVFIGGAYGSSASIFIQQKDHAFEEKVIPTKEYEDLGAVLFDADGDDDLDLYVASGGSERYATHSGYIDRIYINDGKGNFNIDTSALPTMISSTSAVTAGDYDQDGDMDLFVGGRVIPGQYPTIPSSYILENINGKFKDVTDRLNSSIRNIGMVTSALWTDFNNDSRLDLVIVGESMRVTLFKNDGKQLLDISDQTALRDSYGMWNSLLAGDFDNDGDMDFIAGNLGLNNPFQVTREKPLQVYYADFDNNGSTEPIFSSYEEGVAYPQASLDQLTIQLPALKKYLLHYRDYARATTKDLLKFTGNNAYSALPCNVLTSSFIENLGNDNFSISPLPLSSQFAPINGIIAEDINADGLLDIIAVGNFYGNDVVTGRYDASIGNVLLNAGSNTFIPLNSAETNFEVEGDARGIVRLERGGEESLLMIIQNNDSLKSFTLNSYQGYDRIYPVKEETSAIIILSDGKQKIVEFSTGGSYLSQSSKSIVIIPQIVEVQFKNSEGRITRKVVTKQKKLQ